VGGEEDYRTKEWPLDQHALNTAASPALGIVGLPFTPLGFREDLPYNVEELGDERGRWRNPDKRGTNPARLSEQA